MKSTQPWKQNVIDKVARQWISLLDIRLGSQQTTTGLVGRIIKLRRSVQDQKKYERLMDLLHPIVKTDIIRFRKQLKRWKSEADLMVNDEESIETAQELGIQQRMLQKYPRTMRKELKKPKVGEFQKVPIQQQNQGPIQQEKILRPIEQEKDVTMIDETKTEEKYISWKELVPSAMHTQQVQVQDRQAQATQSQTHRVKVQVQEEIKQAQVLDKSLPQKSSYTQSQQVTLKSQPTLWQKYSADLNRLENTKIQSFSSPMDIIREQVKKHKLELEEKRRNKPEKQTFDIEKWKEERRKKVKEQEANQHEGGEEELQGSSATQPPRLQSDNHMQIHQTMSENEWEDMSESEESEKSQKGKQRQTWSSYRRNKTQKISMRLIEK